MSNYDYNKANDSSLIKDGDYEVYIEKIEEKTLPSGKQKLAIKYRVRSDVEQEYANRCIFEDIWAERLAPQFYNRKRINQLLGTQHPKDHTEFNDINNVIQFLEGCNLIVHINTVLDEYRGEDVNTVGYYKSTKNPTGTIVSPDEKKSGGVSVENDDDKLPF